MRILFVCRSLPHAAARDSGRLDTFHYIKGLSQFHSVSLLTFLSKEEEPFLASLTSICKHIETVPFFQQRLSARIMRLIFRQLFTRVYGRVFSQVFKRALQNLINNQQYDLVIVDGMMGIYTQWIDGPKIILDEVDVFSHMAYQEFRHSTAPLQRLHRWQDWLRTTHKENLFLKNVDGAWVRSQKDKLILKDLHPTKPIHVIQPWFEGLESLQAVPRTRPQGNKILFMGAMNLFTNIEAVTFFAKQVFPLVQNAIPDAEFLVVGSAPSDSVKALARQNQAITVTGEVADLTPFYKDCTVCVVPLFVGGGIIVKTLNGLAAGRPVVATPLGNSGTGAQKDKHLLIEDPIPERFAAAVIQLLQNDVLWNELAEEGRALIRQNFNWKSSIESLDKFISGV
ncbi:MAG: glycosyltransferase [Chloroflexota bacterium]